MRYTTVIDVTEIADVWRNPNISRLYFFMALKCGYHDDDRDILKISLRSLAAQASLTISATRHALKVLVSLQLVTQEKDAFRIKKFILEQKVTPRARTKQQQEAKNLAEQREAEQRKLDKKLEEERRMRGNDELFVKQVEEFIKKPSSITRNSFLKASQERYFNLTGKHIEIENLRL